MNPPTSAELLQTITDSIHDANSFDKLQKIECLVLVFKFRFPKLKKEAAALDAALADKKAERKSNQINMVPNN